MKLCFTQDLKFFLYRKIVLCLSIVNGNKMESIFIFNIYDESSKIIDYDLFLYNKTREPNKSLTRV